MVYGFWQMHAISTIITSYRILSPPWNALCSTYLFLPFSSQTIDNHWSVCFLYSFTFSSFHLKNSLHGNSLAVQWLGLCTFTAEGPGSILGQGTKIPQATQRDQNRQTNNLPLYVWLSEVSFHWEWPAIQSLWSLFCCSRRFRKVDLSLE